MRRLSFRRACALGLFVPLAALVISTGASGAVRHATRHLKYSQQITITFPVAEATEFLPMEIGAAANIYQQYGLNVKIQIIAPAALDAALEAGSVQFAADAAPALELFEQEGGPIKMLGMWAERGDTFLAVRPDIKTIKDLVGKGVGTAGPGSYPTLETDYALTTAGIPINSVTMIPLDPSAAIGALVSGEVSAADFTVEEIKQAQAALPGIHSIFSFYSLRWPDPELWGYAPWMTAHKAETVEFMRAMNAAIVKWNNDPTLAKQVIKTIEGATSQATIDAAYQSTVLDFNKGSVPLYEPTVSQERFVIQLTSKNGYPKLTESYAQDGQVWTSTYWCAAFGCKS